MDKNYHPSEVESHIYDLWEKGSHFIPRLQASGQPSQKPFCIILPPPNANAPLHMGHAMYVIEDIMIRYHRMKGESTLWLPGADHAGFETQYVFEKHLAKEGKSRFDFPRETLYQMIWDFVQVNRGTMENQLRRLGFSLDWTRNTFTLDPAIVKIVYQTFKKLYDDGLIYRGERLVNYCTKCGTGFSDLEVSYVERNDPLYYIKYGPFTIATARPETKFRDTALAVNPKDKRYKDWLGQTLDISGLLGPITMTVIADEGVDPKFGTGIMKVTPAHDPHDFELGKKYNLAVTPIIDFNGRMDFSWFLAKKGVDPKYRERAEKYHRKKVAQARQLMVADLKEDGFLIKINEKYTHRIGVCYKCGTVIEPLPLPQWFVKVEPLAKKAAAVVREKKIKILPRRLEKTVLDWLVNFKDWNISRQVVWGMRIPAWQCVRCAKEEYESWIVTAGEKPKQCPKCGGIELVQDPDTFDTWFSSGQWPFATLKASHYKNDFEYFYPTSVMETAYDILPWWVCRMIMLGLYATGDTPFKTVYFHGLVRDKDGQKMSKSKGNVVNPMELIEKYGADALRISLVFGTKAGSDQSFSTDKIIGFRNFANKLWNIARFILLNTENKPIKYLPDEKANPSEAIAYCRSVLKELDQLIKKVSDHMERYQFEKAAELHYEYTWHTFADKHLETAKKWLSEESLDSPYIRGTLIVILEHILSLFHPFMPFITEEIWSKLPDRKELLIISPWPSQNKKS